MASKGPSRIGDYQHLGNSINIISKKINLSVREKTFEAIRANIEFTLKQTSKNEMLYFHLLGANHRFQKGLRSVNIHLNNIKNAKGTISDGVFNFTLKTAVDIAKDVINKGIASEIDFYTFVSIFEGLLLPAKVDDNKISGLRQFYNEKRDEINSANT